VADGGGPTVVRRQLGKRLRSLRERSGKAIKDVERAKLFSVSKMIRIEAGRTEVKIGDVWTLCRFYGVTDNAVIDTLTALAEGTSQRAWWGQHTGSQLRDWFALYLGLEEGADHILMWDAELIHGLLQTPEYAAAVNAAAIDVEADPDEVIRLRLARQERFFSREPVGQLQAVIGQGALVREVGGVTVRQAQLQHLRQLATRNHVDIRVLPWSAGAHAAMTGGFTIFDFADPDDPAAVYVESLVSGSYHEQEQQIRRFRAAFAAIHEQSIPIEEFQP
jgi:transcriptional regulator with XRE-family HTH domain